MLSIYVVGPLEEGFLELSSSTSMQLESYADAFDEDFATGEFTLPVELPWTDKNRRLLGFAERLENFSAKPEYYNCTVFDDGFPELPNAKMVILEKTGTYTYLKGKFNVSISSSKGLFGSRIKGKNLKDLVFTPITWTGKDSREFATDVMKGLYPELNHIVFTPVAMEGFIDTNRPDYTTEFIAGDIVNYPQFVGTSTWKFGRASATTPGTIAASGNIEYIDYRTIPFINLKWLIIQIFSQLGYTVGGYFIDGNEFDDLVLFNNYAIENYSPTTYVDYNRSINIINHLPDVSIANFLKEIFLLFNIYPTFINNVVNLSYRSDLFSQKDVADLTPYVNSEFTSTFEDAQSSDSNGYTLKMEWDSSDSYYSDHVKDISTKKLRGTVVDRFALSSLSFASPSTDDIVFVEADNMYYVIADATTTPYLWDIYSEKLTDFIVGSGEKTISINVSTLCSYVRFKNSTKVFEQIPGIVATRQLGSYINYKGITVKNNFGIRIFYSKKQTAFLFQVPTSFNHNRAWDSNNQIETYSLCWHNADGLATLHNSWQNLRIKAEVLKTNILVNQKVLNILQTHNIWQINNVMFLPYQTTRTLPLTEQMEIRLVPL